MVTVTVAIPNGKLIVRGLLIVAEPIPGPLHGIEQLKP